VAGNLRGQYREVVRMKLPATWLLTFDVLVDDEAMGEVKEMDERQEVGMFWEVTPALAEVAGVKLVKSESWYHADSLFLTGYTQDERKRLIDAGMEKVKERVGDYPVAVGSWWTDSFSLSYMREKYGVEVAGLEFLKSEPEGKVMVWDKDCRSCKWQTRYKPAALANKRDYVAKWSGKELVYNSSVLVAESGSEGRKLLSETGARYLYLVKYGKYVEETHFSPSDLGLEKIFETANSQIWMVLEKS